jgi:hypothetical protein
VASPADTPNLNRAELAELSALADGTLDPARRAEVQARIDGSPELSALYEREQRVVAMLHDARAADRAPSGLRARIDAQRPSNAMRARRRIGYGSALAGALAVVVLAVVLLLPGGTPGSPSLSQAAALALRGPTTHAVHGANVEDVYFPDWHQQDGWHATGMRTDKINGRTATTVYYRYDGSPRTVAYTIVGAPALKTPDVTPTRWNRIELQTLMLDGRLIVTWKNDNHTCVISAVGIAGSQLRQLAAHSS